MPEIVNTSSLAQAGTSSIEGTDDRETVIKVEGVSMVFNMASERLDNLKEYFLKLVKHELFFEEFTALDNISLEVKKGDVYGIIGTNGSGKSTLLKIVAGVLEPTTGSVSVKGRIAPLIELGAGFDMDLSARENIYLNGALLGYSKPFIDEHFDEIVEFAELEAFLDMPLKNYSSGMVARIAFAIATMIVPDILIVDEVLSVGDFMFQKKCEERINELITEHGVTIFIVSHSNAQIARLCNKVIWIEKGHMRLQGDGESTTRIYDALGGRVGSKEAEERLFKLLTTTSSEQDGHEIVTISDASAGEINLSLIGHTEKAKAGFDTIILACNSYPVNSLMANGLASAYEAPILPIDRDRIPPIIRQWIELNEPADIIVFDIGLQGEAATQELKSLRYAPNVTVIGKKGHVHGFSEENIVFGSKIGAWGDNAAILSLADCQDLFACAPYLYKMHCPLFIQTDESWYLDATIALFKEHGISKAVIFGSSVPEDYEGRLTAAGIETTRIAGGWAAETSLEISRFTAESFGGVGGMQVAPFSYATWPDLISCGYYAQQHDAPLLLCDDTNLDLISESISFIQETCEDGPLTFIQGRISLSETEVQLLSSC